MYQGDKLQGEWNAEEHDMLDGKVFTIYKYNSNDEYGPDDIIAENVVEWIADKDYTVEDYDMDTSVLK